MIRYLHSFSVWIKTGFNSGDINRFGTLYCNRNPKVLKQGKINSNLTKVKHLKMKILRN